MVVVLSIIFFILGLMVGFLLLKKLWEPEWYRRGYDEGYADYEAENVVVIADDVPEKPTKKNLVMKLQNELANYVEVSDSRVQIKVVGKNVDLSERDESNESEIDNK